MTLLLVLASAHAAPSSDAAFTCALRIPVQLAPIDGAVDVPLDAHLRVLFEGEGCGDDGGTLRLSDETGVVLEAIDLPSEVVSAGAVMALAPEGGLEPDTDYDLVFESWSGEVLSSSFQTGAAPRGTDPVPEVDLRVAGVAEAWWDGDVLWAQVDVAAVNGTPGDLVRFAERIADPPRIEVVDGTGAAQTSLFLRPASNADEICVVASQQDITGALSEWTEACTDFEAPEQPDDSGKFSDGPGCNTTPGSGGLVLALAALPFLRRRR